MKLALGLTCLALLATSACGGTSPSSSAATGRGVTTTAAAGAEAAKPAAATIAPNSDPCVLLTAAVAQATLGTAVVKTTGPTSPAATWCEYDAAADANQYVQVSVATRPVSRPDYDRTSTDLQATWPAGSCAPVPAISDSATFCPDVSSPSGVHLAFLETLAGPTRVSVRTESDTDAGFASQTRLTDLMRRSLAAA